MSTKSDISIHATQIGQQMHAIVHLDGFAVTAFNISASEFECLIAAFGKKPVVTVTHGEPTATPEGTRA